MSKTRLWRWLTSVVLLISLARTSWGQVFARDFQPGKTSLPELSAEGERAWERSLRFAREDQAAECIDALRLVIDQHASELKLADQYRLGTQVWERFVPADVAAQELLLRWQETAPAALNKYRELYNTAAERELAAAQQTRTLPAFEKLLRTGWSCDSGPSAVLQMGDLALERGYWQTARAAYGRLHPLTSVWQGAEFHTAGLELVEPFRGKSFDTVWARLGPQIVKAAEGAPRDESVSTGTVLARLTLVSLLAGETARAETELKLLEKLASEETGYLAGRSGKLAAILRDLQRANSAAKPAALLATSFAANDHRDGVYPSLPTEFEAKPRWTISLPEITAAHDVLGTGRQRIADDEPHVLAYFPLVVNDQVFVRSDGANQSQIAAYQLRDGKEAWKAVEEFPATDRAAAIIRTGQPRHTLSQRHGSLFAKMGSSLTIPSSRKSETLLPKDQGFLVGLDLASEGRPLEGFPLFPPGTEWSLEGPPLVDEGCFYIAVAKREGNRRQSYVACYETLTVPLDTSLGNRDGRHRGRLRWRTLVASGETVAAGELDEITQTLLSRHEETLFISTNLGAVAAVGVDDGRLRWLVRYPRSPRSSQPNAVGENCFIRDLTPPVVHRGRVVFAPSDSPRVFAVHERSGLPAWTTTAEAGDKIVSLLGATGDFLITAGDQLFWQDIFTGEVVGTFPETPQKDVIGYGRGFLTPQHIYWPTKQAIHILPVEPRKSAAVVRIDLLARGLIGGNLVPFRDGLLIAGSSRLSCLFATEPADRR